MNPKLIINLFKLRTNLDRLVDRCHAVGIKTAIVTKVFCADERICKMISESDADAFADSRVQNLAAIAELHSDKPTQLLRISMQSEVEDVVRYADISMQSEKETIRLIGGAAKKLGKVHKIILIGPLPGNLPLRAHRERRIGLERPRIRGTEKRVIHYHTPGRRLLR